MKFRPFKFAVYLWGTGAILIACGLWHVGFAAIVYGVVYQLITDPKPEVRKENETDRME